ncbi:MAG: hypothetical protein EZS28_035572 [Streblomastix strix]|uniref:Uncharacterized protein n=1 Tax=Streblomastix strix TaxID=222440 RepID=A0A5J4UFR9_9EUKA|nr:MAG: hypothetical protein EZS28_035572 [Streblomastix strix]
MSLGKLKPQNLDKNKLHASLISQDALQNYLTQPVTILLERTSTPANRIDAFLKLTPLISSRDNNEIKKISSSVLLFLFGNILKIIKNYRRIGNIDNGEKDALYKFLRKTCSFATITCRVFNTPNCLVFLSHMFPLDKTKFVVDRDKNQPIHHIPRTSKSAATYLNKNQIVGQEIHFHLLDKFLKYDV